MTVTTHFHNLTAAWHRRVLTSLERCRAGVSDFSWVNVGDSIATGRIGIESAADHYAAVASRELAHTAGLPSDLLLHTAHGPQAGVISWSGAPWPVRATEAGLFGAGSWCAEPGNGSVLTFAPQRPVSKFTVTVENGSGFDVSTDGGQVWQNWAKFSAACDGSARVDVPAGVAAEPSIMLRAAGPGCSLLSLAARDDRRTTFRWYTSGVPGARIPDVARMLSVSGGAAAVYRGLAVDLITVAIGVNDSIHADEQALSDSAAGLRALVGSLLDRQSACVALVGAVPVRDDYQPGPWRVRDAYRDVYRPVAEEFGLPLLEVEPAWGGHDRAARDGFFADHVHPSVDGHAAIARDWVDVLNGSGIKPSPMAAWS